MERLLRTVFVDFVIYLDHDKKAGRRAVHTTLETAGMGWNFMRLEIHATELS